MNTPAEFWSNVNRLGDCWLWTRSKRGKGYGSIRWRGAQTFAHRVSWELHAGPVPDGLFVLHRCDVRLCVRPDHLFLGTKKDNYADCAAKGRNSCGARNGQARFGDKEALEIRRLRREGVMVATLAERFGVSTRTIHRITTGASWSRLEAAESEATEGRVRSLTAASDARLDKSEELRERLAEKYRAPESEQAKKCDGCDKTDGTHRFGCMVGGVRSGQVVLSAKQEPVLGHFADVPARGEEAGNG